MTRLRLLKTANKYSVRTLHVHGSIVPLSTDSPFAVPRAPSPTRPNASNPSTQQSDGQGNPHPSSSSLPLASTSQSSSPVVPATFPTTSNQFSLSFLPLRLPAPQASLRPQNAGFRLAPGAHGLPKPRPRPLPPTDDSLSLATQVGEDAYFIRPDALAVADGVGGWASQRHQRPSGPPSNSALFSRRLIHYCSLEMDLNPSQDPDPVQILQRGYETSFGLSLAEGLLGSSTALLAVLARHAMELRIAHVGDCCAFVVRDQEIVFRTEEMQHAFNYPLQLGPLSPTTPREHAQRLDVPVRENDIIILSTDGMSDNLWDEDVLQQVARFATSFKPPSSTARSQSLSPLKAALLPITLSHALCTKAKSIAENGPIPQEGEMPEVPFGRRAKEAGHSFSGGKQDDITVVVAVIAREQS